MPLDFYLSVHPKGCQEQNIKNNPEWYTKKKVPFEVKKWKLACYSTGLCILRTTQAVPHGRLCSLCLGGCHWQCPGSLAAQLGSSPAWAAFSSSSNYGHHQSRPVEFCIFNLFTFLFYLLIFISSIQKKMELKIFKNTHILLKLLLQVK